MSEVNAQIEIVVNGEAQFVPEGITVTDLIARWELSPQRLAIECNQFILARALWSTTQIQAGDRLEVVHFVGGG